MPSINSRTTSRTTATPTPAATNGATATTATTATTANGSATGGTVPQGGGNAVNARRVAMGASLSAINTTALGINNRFARDATFDSYQANATANGAVGRGFIKTNATPIAGGCRLHVESFHGQHNDKLTLSLLAEVFDKKTNQLRTVTVSILTNGENLNATAFRGNTYFDINYADLNGWLKQKNPNLQITPGSTSLAVAAKWHNGHQAGGFSRGGVFRLPPAAQTQNAVSVRAVSAAAATDEADLPLDMQVAFTPDITRAIPQLKADGNILTRLESELKGGTDKPSMVKAVHTMYDLAAKVAGGDKKDVEKIFGKDWTIETVNRYWLKDDGSSTEGVAGKGFFKGFRVDPNGLPIQDPMKDTYMDDGNLRMTRHEGAIRLRSNQQATVINVKPGGGRVDEKTRIAQRVEVGIELKPNATVMDASRALQVLNSGNNAGTIFNHAQRQVAALDSTLNLSQTLVPWLDVVQDRHKFTIKNEKTGVEVELSLDFVKAMTNRPNHVGADGKPQTVEFCVLEAELDHLQLQSANQASVAGQSAGSGAFNSEAQQDQWLAATSDQVTMDIDPRLHELKDLDNASFRNTVSYKSFETMSKKLTPFLFPAGLEPGRQKAAAAAEMLGLVVFDDKELLNNTKKAVEDGGLKWSAELRKGFEAAIKDPVKRFDMEDALASGAARRNVGVFVEDAVGSLNGVEYSLKGVKDRVSARLAELGLVPEHKTLPFLDTITPANVSPRNLDSFLSRMPQYQDHQVFTQLAQALGVTPVPTAKVDMVALIASGEQQKILDAQLDAGAIDPKDKGAIEKFFVELGAKGMTAFEVRQQLPALSQNTQVRLTQLATARGITAPTIHADPKVIVIRFEPNLPAHFLKTNKSVTDFVKQVCQQRTHAEAIQFAQQVAGNPEVTMQAEAKRLNITAPTFDRDWTAVEAQLKPQLARSNWTYDAKVQKLVETAVENGVPVATLARAFQQTGTQPLDQALKGQGIYLVGVAIPDLKADFDAAETAVRAALQAYAAAMPSSAAFKRMLEGAVKAGLSPAQAQAWVQVSLQNGKVNAARYAPNIPATSLPAIELDQVGFEKAMAQRLGAAWTPAHAAFAKANVEGAINNNIGLAHTFGQNQRQACTYIAQGSGQALPAGL